MLTQSLFTILQGASKGFMEAIKSGSKIADVVRKLDRRDQEVLDQRLGATGSKGKNDVGNKEIE